MFIVYKRRTKKSGDRNLFLQSVSVLFQAKSEEQVATEKQWLDAEKIWLMHRGGFAAARRDITAKSEPGKLIIRLDQTGDVLTVDEDDVEKVCEKTFIF